ncbi:MAG TPA: hypothetical protein VH880_00730 [Anaeromyxobacteraceae bacterium]|jgi:hypothetical protein
MLPSLLALALLAPRLQAAPAARAEVPLPDARRILARLAASEPPVEDVQRAAERLASAAPEEAASWRRRAGLAHWLPSLSAWFRHDDRSQRTLGLSASGEVDVLRLAPQNEVGVRLTWDLPALVFSDAELRAAEASDRSARRRAEAASHATRLYFRRRSLLAALALAPPSDPVALAAAELDVDLVTAELDGITGGLFGGRR